MLNLSTDPISTQRQPAFAQWLRQVLDGEGGRVQFRWRGNSLHLLCEATPCPSRTAILEKLIPALQQTPFNSLLTEAQPYVYQIVLYGRQTGQSNPVWIATLDPSQPEPPPHPTATTVQDAATASWGAQSLTPGAIARRLSETFSSHGISVRASLKTLPPAPQSSAVEDRPVPARLQRLGIICEANYSIESAVLAEPIARQLRELPLSGCRDAVVVFRVRGEAQPDWTLRVDLTPPDEILRDAARWGDVGAITRLLSQTLRVSEVAVSTAALHESTLHLSFVRLPPADLPSSLSTESDAPQTTLAPDQIKVTQQVLPLLQELAPQGIHGATLYGQEEGEDLPAWVEWADLPAATQPQRAELPLILAKQGNWEAIAFLLGRLLNADLDRQLATGGIHLQLLPKGDLLHIMSDAATCPDREQVGPAIARFVRDLHLPELTGVRVYGRRSGQKQPIWSYGSDFVQRGRLVPEATPEFAATAAYVNDLISAPGELVHHPQPPAQENPSTGRRFWAGLGDRLRVGLLRSQLFLPTDGAQATPTPLPEGQIGKLAIIWGAVGLLVAVQIDWGFGRLVQSSNPEVAIAAPPAAPPLPPEVNPNTSPTAASQTEAAQTNETTSADRPSTPQAPAATVTPSAQQDSKSSPFNPEGFTRELSPPTDTSLQEQRPRSSSSRPAPPISLPFTQPDPRSQATAASVLSSESPYPTFNSRQLNEKLMLYTEQLKQSGPPDVLIVGSSRALRGVDPAALQETLATLGYSDVSVFNFGINGATAQVVDLIVRDLLKPDQLPRLIIWADGARAFNSGTVDVTYNGIVVSEGYRQLAQGTLARPQINPGEGPNTSTTTAELPNAGLGASLADSYEEMDRWLSDRLSHVSAAFGERDRVKNQLQTWITTLLPLPAATEAGIGSPQPLTANPQTTQSLSEEARDLIDFEGFLPISMRFNPATYFQEYARVVGQYDSDYEDFRLEGNQTVALQSLLQFTRSQNIPLVFVNTPLTDEYLDPFRQEKEAEFRQFMVQTSLQEPGFIFRDLGEVWTRNYDYFSDPSHLNRYGAYQVSRRLAQDAMIPWGQVDKP